MNAVQGHSRTLAHPTEVTARLSEDHPLYDPVCLATCALDTESAQRAFDLGYTCSYPVEVVT